MQLKPRHTALMGALIAAPFTASVAVAQEEAASGEKKPLSEIVKTVEDQGYEPISEVSMDDGVWEVEASKNDEEHEIKVDPASGEIISEERD